MKGKPRFAWSRNVKHHFLLIRILTSVCKPGEGQCVRVSLTGAVSSQRVTEEREAWLSMVGNHASSVWVDSQVNCETYKSSRCESRPK